MKVHDQVPVAPLENTEEAQQIESKARLDFMKNKTKSTVIHPTLNFIEFV